MTTSRRIAIVASILAAAVSASADSIVLQGGRRVVGTIVSEDDEKVVIEITIGTITARTAYARKNVASIMRGDTPAKPITMTPRMEYQKRRAELAADDARGYLDLATWCVDSRLLEEAAPLLAVALDLCPGLATEAALCRVKLNAWLSARSERHVARILARAGKAPYRALLGELRELASEIYGAPPRAAELRALLSSVNDALSYPCRSCEGAGTPNCGLCDGAGQIEGQCRHCGGRGGLTCRKCGGRGQIECDRCDGRAYVRGIAGGRLDCNKCTKGGITCRGCGSQRQRIWAKSYGYGEGRVRCGTCKGAKVAKAPCRDCGGRGHYSCRQCAGTGRGHVPAGEPVADLPEIAGLRRQLGLESRGGGRDGE